MTKRKKQTRAPVARKRGAAVQVVAGSNADKLQAERAAAAAALTVGQVVRVNSGMHKGERGAVVRIVGGYVDVRLDGETKAGVYQFDAYKLEAAS